MKGMPSATALRLIHNFRIMDETYLMLVVVEKGGWRLPKAENWPVFDNTVINPELTGGQIPLQQKYCHKSESALFAVCQHWFKLLVLSFSSRWLTMTGLFANVSSLLLRREDCLPARPGNCKEFQCPLQGNGYGNTGGMGKLEGVREQGYGAFPAQLRMLH